MAQSIAIARLSLPLQVQPNVRPFEIEKSIETGLKVGRCPKLTASTIPIKGLPHPRRPILPFDSVGSNISSQPALPVQSMNVATPVDF